MLIGQKFKCAISEIDIRPGVNASLDHVIPKSRGGLSTIDNLRWVDVRVNKAKNNMLDTEFIEFIDKLSVALKVKDHGYSRAA